MDAVAEQKSKTEKQSGLSCEHVRTPPPGIPSAEAAAVIAERGAGLGWQSAACGEEAFLRWR